MLLCLFQRRQVLGQKALEEREDALGSRGMHATSHPQHNELS